MNESMLKVQQTGFAVTELGLYLDTHPNDAQALAAYTRAVNAYRAAVAEYQALYGPLTQPDAAADTWLWGARPGPWQEV